MRRILQIQRARRGVALIFTLLVLAVLITLVATLSTSSKLDIMQAENTRDDEQNKILLDSAIRLVEHVLLQDLQNSKFDSFHEPWAKPVKDLVVGESTISWEMVDEGGKLNINLLAIGDDRQKDTMQQVLARLVKRVSDDNGVVLRGSDVVTIIQRDPYQLAVQGILEFLEKKIEEASSKGAIVVEDQKIRLLRPILFEIDELIGVQGMTPELLYGYRGNKGLADYLTVWSDMLVNVNTAPEAVLKALVEDFTDEDVKTIVDYRATNDITKVDDVAEIQGVQPSALEELRRVVSVTSRYFVASIRVKTGNLERTAKVVLRRPDIAKVAAGEAPPTVGIVYYKSGV